MIPKQVRQVLLLLVVIAMGATQAAVAQEPPETSIAMLFGGQTDVHRLHPGNTAAASPSSTAPSRNAAAGAGNKRARLTKLGKALDSGKTDPVELAAFRGKHGGPFLFRVEEAAACSSFDWAGFRSLRSPLFLLNPSFALRVGEPRFRGREGGFRTQRSALQNAIAGIPEVSACQALDPR